MRRTNTIAIAALLAALATAPAAAQQEVDETRPAAPDGTVKIENISGSVRVNGWDRDEVRVRGRLGAGVERLDIESTTRRTDIRVVVPRHGRNVGSSELEIDVPARSLVDVQIVSANVGVEGLAGEIRVEAVSGDVEVKGSTHDLDLQSVSGDVEAQLDGTLDRAELETVSGDIRLTATPAARAKVRAESVSGDVEIRLPGGVAADVEVSTFSGEIRNGLSDDRVERQGYGPGAELRFSVGGGGTRIVVSSFSGDVTLDRR